MRHRTALIAGLLAVAVPFGVTARATPVGDALDRPAVVSRLAAQSVLLGAAQSGQRVIAVGERGIVVLSDDGGRSWRQAAMPTSVTLTAVRFDGAHGIAVGHGGSVMTSDDAGSTWTRRLDGRRAAQLVLDAARAAGEPGPIKAAQRLVDDGPDKPLLDVLAFDANRALVVGAYGLAFATDDGGKTWASWMPRLPNPKGLHLYAVRARGEHIVIAGEQGLLLHSGDGGRSFTRSTLPYKGSFFTLELTADDEIVVAGLRGNVWRSTDAGASWAPVPVPMPVAITGSALRPDGALVFVNQAGAVLAGRGGVIAPLKTHPLPPLNAVLARPDGSLLALGVQGAIVLPAGAAP